MILVQLHQGQAALWTTVLSLAIGRATTASPHLPDSVALPLLEAEAMTGWLGSGLKLKMLNRYLGVLLAYVTHWTYH